MQWILIVVTLASLVTAGALAALLWRMTRDERERSEARVAALGAEIEAPHAATAAFDWPPHDAGDPPFDADAPVRAAALFGTANADSSTRRLGPAVAVVALALATLAGAALLVGPGAGPSVSTAASGREVPLELLSLRHERREGLFTVTGFARNPAHAAPVERLTAVVFFFDDRGEFLASGRAPLDFTRLGPGDESPFTVSATVPESVRRYRVSFRRESGGVAPHVDRRGRD